jgi:hypothetical protein
MKRRVLKEKFLKPFHGSYPGSSGKTEGNSRKYDYQ